MSVDPNFASIAALIGEPTRAAFLGALLGGTAHTASELAHLAGVTAQTASMHLARLVEGNLVKVSASGRHRYYELASPQVAHVLETLATIAPPARIASLRESERARAMRFARTCYDHLAGRVGVALNDRLIERGFLIVEGEHWQISATGERWLKSCGVDLAAWQKGRRAAARPCLDWSERRYHLAGAAGAAITHWLLHEGWITRIGSSRAVQLTPKGRAGFQQEWDLSFD